VSVNTTVSGGTGTWGGLATGSYSSSGVSGSIGGGWGIGLGEATIATYTYPIWQNNNPQKCK
jgi:hypothetical protein